MRAAQYNIASNTMCIDKHRSATRSFPRVPPPVQLWAVLAVRGYAYKSSMVVNLLSGEVFYLLLFTLSHPTDHRSRRIAAATGSPQGISDNVIEQPLPTDSIGFTPAAPMRTSIKLARVYGQIMTGAPSYNISRLKANIVSIVLYGSTIQTEDTFISNVQSIIRSLCDISDEIPLELATGMPKLGHDLSLRTSAALHLMFYQVCFNFFAPVNILGS